MENNSEFETFLFISPKKIVLSVNKIKHFKLIFKEEMIIKNFFNELDFETFDNFLNQNIFKVEKILGNFVKNINVIIESKEFFTFKIAVKKNNYDNILTPNALVYLLNDAKDQCDKSIDDKKIIHFLIDNYLIDNNSYSNLPLELECKNFSLDLSFICLPRDIIEKIEELLKRYQISINQLLSADYVKKHCSEENFDFFNMAYKILSGYNKNEVKIVSKNSINKGFFEKFFNFFN